MPCLNPWDCQSRHLFTIEGAMSTLYAGEKSGGNTIGVFIRKKRRKTNDEKTDILDTLVDVAEKLPVLPIEADLLRLAAIRIKEFGEEDGDGVLLLLAAAKIRQLKRLVDKLENKEAIGNHNGKYGLK